MGPAYPAPDEAPPEAFAGDDSFQYVALDASSESEPATVTITSNVRRSKRGSNHRRRSSTEDMVAISPREV